MPEHPHEWVKNSDGSIDIFQMNEGYHNGPACTRCLVAYCHHCVTDLNEQECPVASEQPTLFGE